MNNRIFPASHTAGGIFAPDGDRLTWYDDRIRDILNAIAVEMEKEGVRQEWVDAFRTSVGILFDSAAEQQETAKEGLGTVGSFLVDLGVAGTQMLLDVAASGGQGAIVPMLVRCFGSGAYEAAADGGDINEQIFQGIKSAAIEYLSEKLFAGNPAYDEGGGLVTDLIYKAADKLGASKAVARVLESTPVELLGEALEEMFSDALNPLVNRTANWLDGGARNTDMPDLETLLSDAAIGAALGGLAKAGEAAGNRGSEQASNTQNTKLASGDESGIMIFNTDSANGHRSGSYSERGIELPQNIQQNLEQMQNKGDYIMGRKGDFSELDASVMSRETGVEFAHITIGDKAYLIRGDNKGTIIPNEMLAGMIENGGQFEYHTHPYDGDCRPSQSDMDMMAKLEEWTGQTESLIITPDGKQTLYNKDGVIDVRSISNKITEARKKAFLELFGGNNNDS